jgi:ATP-dependent exoDNAse (exonuclease V) beta subunit
VSSVAEPLPVEDEIEKLVDQVAALPKPSRPGPLFKANPDPDARYKALRFDADAHQYYINGQPATAVSTIVSRFFPEFDTAYWSTRKAFDNGCTAEELAQQWADKAAASSSAGTTLHQQIEEFYNHGTPGIGPDFVHFLSFHHAHAHLVPHRTEWQVYNEELMLAGTVDFVARNSDGTMSIYDWKRSHKVVDASGQIKLNSYQTKEGPLKDLPDCSFSHYTLQQNIYKWLLESSYGCRVRDMNLVVLHPDLDRYHVVPVPERPQHVAHMLAAVRAQR